MKFDEIAKQLLPEYVLLSEEARVEFAQRKAGQILAEKVSLIQDFIQSITPTGLWGWLWNSTETQTKIDQEIQARKIELAKSLQTCEDYQRLHKEMVYKIILERFPELQLSSLLPKKVKAIQEQFFATGLMQNSLFLSILIELEINIQKLREPPLSDNAYFLLAQFGEQKEQVLQEWHTKYSTSKDYAFYREALLQQEEDEKTARLLRIVKILPGFDITLTFKNEADIEEALTCFLFKKLQDALDHQQLDFVDLQNFNFTHANRFAKAILIATKTVGEEILLSNWLDYYKGELTAQITKKLKSINGKSLVKKELKPLDGVYNSLSYIWDNRAVNGAVNFLNKLSDAHLFLTYTGATAQNDSWTAFLDLYNAGRLTSQVTETKAIFFSLFKPFLPLYEEFRDIALREKNYFLKLFRTVMPFIIVAGFVALISAALTPLAIPEFAIILLAIPAFFIGLALATFYITLKNTIYQQCQILWYGGPFEIPEYQVSERMIRIFGTEETAEYVRQLYIEEIKQCDLREQEFQKQPGGDQARLDARENNTKKRHSLNLEWYDMHSNHELAFEQVRQIVANRITAMANEEYDQLEMVLTNKDLPEIRDIIAEIRTSLEESLTVSPSNEVEQTTPGNDDPKEKITLLPLVTPTRLSEESERLLLSQVDYNGALNPFSPVTPTGLSVESQSFSLSPAHRFFPHSKKHHKKTTELDSYRSEIQARVGG